MEYSKKDFQILDALDNEEITTQRQLSEHTGISLGQVNYVIKSFLDKGLVKIGNFRKNHKKIGYAYLLTPKGMETKSKLAVDFVTSKLKEYKKLRQKLENRLIQIENNSQHRIIYIGPDIVKELIATIIKEKELKIILIDSCPCIQDFNDASPDKFDIILLFDGNQISDKHSEIPPKKVMALW